MPYLIIYLFVVLLINYIRGGRTPSLISKSLKVVLSPAMLPNSQTACSAISGWRDCSNLIPKPMHS